MPDKAHQEEPPAPLLGLVREFRAVYRRLGRAPLNRDAVRRFEYWPSLDQLPRHEPNARQAKAGLPGYLKRGWCIWCHRRCARAKQWHPECGAQYQAARGLTVGFYGPLIRPRRGGPCEQCGVHGTEIDHRMAISVARHLGYRHHIRAYTLGNLRWLCESCHKVKTKADAGLLARMRRADRIREQLDREWPLLLAGPQEPGQLELFGGLR